MIKNVLFDLDGTLLPMDFEVFMKSYFGLLCEKAQEYGFEPKKLIDTVWAGVAAMVKNDGSRMNDEVFWEVFGEKIDYDVVKAREIFDSFYDNEFEGARKVCGQDDRMVNMVRKLKQGGCRVILATNPIFPEVATLKRIGWAGFEPQDFELITTYENIGYSKPNPDYYTEIINVTGCNPSETIMVGNDVTEDLVAQKANMEVFLLDRDVINKENKDYSDVPHGGVEEMIKYLSERTGVELLNQ